MPTSKWRRLQWPRSLTGWATGYARVDVIDGNEGLPVVLEVELVEPSLFLSAATGSADRFATVLAGLVGS